MITRAADLVDALLERREDERVAAVDELVVDRRHVDRLAVSQSSGVNSSWWITVALPALSPSMLELGRRRPTPPSSRVIVRSAADHDDVVGAAVEEPAPSAAAIVARSSRKPTS